MNQQKCKINHPMSQLHHPKFNVHNPKHSNIILNYKQKSDITKNPFKFKMGSGPNCPGHNCPPWKSGKLDPGQLGPKNLPSQKPKNYKKKQNTASKMQQGCSQISNMLPNIPNTQVKTVQILNNHTRSHNHHPKYHK